MNKFIAYIKESREELIHKTSWPTWEQLQDSLMVERHLITKQQLDAALVRLLTSPIVSGELAHHSRICAEQL
ncbi:MAG: hypothetical protein ACKO7V_09775, partial [Bacteroidota bacterium]